MLGSDQGRRPTRGHYLWGVFQTVREWRWLAHLGFWLSQLEEAGRLPKSQLKVPFISGAFHTGLANKLHDLGIPNESYAVTKRTTGPHEELKTEAEVFHFTTTNTVTPQQQLTKFLDKLASERS